jgi:UDP-hydrolysing UDP-N-acetyl-D-glucosamine 2-epimerase|tara:strand:+ start:121 stop:1266 length:1146 start_codon:yes stop_codon:yes gene_type:complete
MKKQKIFALSVGRSDYDRYYPILDALNNKKNISLFLLVTQSHSDPTFGKTIKFIDKKFKVLKNSYKNKKIKNLTESFAFDLLFVNKKILEHKPDKIIVLGDRYEMLIGPLSAVTYNIPVIHFFGGSVTLGATDELIRHAITKMSHFHFPLLPTYKKRIIQMGEEKWRVKNIGMHQLNSFQQIKLMTKSQLKEEYKFNFDKSFSILTFHPTTLELKNLSQQLTYLRDAIYKTKINAVITFPNADPKNKKIIEFLRKNFNDKKKFLLIKNCGLDLYINLLRHSNFIMGNSSSGIVEAASLKLPSINIGTRQDGKFKPVNVINCDYKSKNIVKAIKLASSLKFKKKLIRMKNPYEAKKSISNLLKIIINIKNNDFYLRKNFKNL